jgi:hypothetical protein
MSVYGLFYFLCWGTVSLMKYENWVAVVKRLKTTDLEDTCHS